MSRRNDYFAAIDTASGQRHTYSVRLKEGKGNGHFALLKSIEYKRKGLPQADAYEAVGFKRDARDFAIAAKILKHINVKSIRLLTDNADKMASLTEQGIDVAGIKKME